jgi:hypothetical protein
MSFTYWNYVLRPFWVCECSRDLCLCIHHLAPVQASCARAAGATTEKSAHSKTHGIATWSFSRGTECGASWTAAALRRRIFYWAPRSGAGGGAGGGAPPPQRILRSCWAGEGLWAYHRRPNGPINGSLWAAGGSEISSRRVDRGGWSGVETAVFGGHWGACRLVDWAGFSVVGWLGGGLLPPGRAQAQTAVPPLVRQRKPRAA